MGKRIIQKEIEVGFRYRTWDNWMLSIDLKVGRSDILDKI
jgi:hypothetical protein